MKILIAIDGSPHSEAALESIIARPWKSGSECRAVIYIEPLSHSPVKSLGEIAIKAQNAYVEDARSLLDQSIAQLKTKFGSANVSEEFLEADPRKQIPQAARSFGADLIVIGAHGNTGELNYELGRTARSVISGADRTIELFRPIQSRSLEKKKQSNQAISENRFLIPIRDTEDGAKVIEHVLSREWSENSRFQILSVIRKLRVPDHPKLFKAEVITEHAKMVHEALHKEAENMLKEKAELLQSRFGKDKVTYHVLEGNPRSLILQIASDWPADQIIMAPQPHNKSIAERLLGSTSMAVAQNAPCSVEIVH